MFEGIDDMLCYNDGELGDKVDDSCISNVTVCFVVVVAVDRHRVYRDLDGSWGNDL